MSTIFLDEIDRRKQEPLSRITFAVHLTCHDVNVSTASSERLDVIIGFSSGDLVWLGAFIILRRRVVKHMASQTLSHHDMPV